VRRSGGPAAAIAGAGALAIAALAGPYFYPRRPLLLWNASPSEPIGLYRLASGGGRTGDMVAAFAPIRFRLLAAKRGYLPEEVPLIKRIAAAAGDRLCTAGRELRINGRTAAIRLQSDIRGRSLPWWQGCRRLHTGEALILGTGPRSFDGRYFGPVPTSALLGEAVLVWHP
jgi:conjugative transfer signal peptidase TraF